MKSLAKRSTLGLLAGFLLFAFAPATGFAQDDGGGKTETYQIDPGHTKVMARADHFGFGYVFVEFLDVSGTLKYNAEKPSKSSIDVTIKTSSLETHQEKRNKHLKGPDFFNAKKYPELTFKSSSADKVDDETLNVSGKLKVAGKTKPIEIKVKKIGAGKGPQGNKRIGFYTEFEINRMDFGIDWKPKATSKMVRIIMSFEGVQK